MNGTRNETYIKAFGINLKKVRLSKNISQEQLAFDADIPISQVSRIERGAVNTTISTIYSIAKVLKIDPKELLDFAYNE